MKKFILIITLFLTICINSFGQGIAQDWFGLLPLPGGNSLHFVFHIVRVGEIYTTTLDSPDQGAKGLQTDKTTVNGNQLTIDATKFGLQYAGTYLPDSNLIKGIFKQAGGAIPLTLVSAKDAAKLTLSVSRPQDPKDFPYKQEEVAFTNSKGGNQLAGTLTTPADGKARKIVVLITGSGPQNRNEELMGHRPFLVWSDWLTRHGIAVLRYDDRGIGKSTGKFQGSTSADFANDAEAAVNYILSRPDLNKLEIGLMGHSEGGLIAPIIACRNPSVKFTVLLAGPGIPSSKLMIKQSEDQMRLSGVPEDAIRLLSETNRQLFNLVIENSGLSASMLKEKIDTLFTQRLRTYPPAFLGGRSISDIVKSSEGTFLDPWFRDFIAYDPAVYLQKVKCPVLALNGTKDMQVNAEANLQAIRSNLEKVGNKHFEIVPLEGLNHLFQKANTGSMSEYSDIKETVDPVALEKVSAWINQL